MTDEKADPKVDEGQMDELELDAVAGGQEGVVAIPVPVPPRPYPYVYNPYAYPTGYPYPPMGSDPNYSPGPTLLNGQWHF